MFQKYEKIYFTIIYIYNKYNIINNRLLFQIESTIIFLDLQKYRDSIINSNSSTINK